MKYSADQVREFAAAAIAAEPGAGVIPPEFFVNMARRESSLNPANVTPEDNQTVSIGLWQVNQEEASSSGMGGADLTDPHVNATVIVRLMMRNLRDFSDRFSFTLSPDAIPDDAWCYLAASHNAGQGRVRGWIESYGITNWADCKADQIAKGFNARHNYEPLTSYADYIGRAAQQAISSKLVAAIEDELSDDSGDLDPLKIALVLLVAGALAAFFLRGHFERLIPA